MTTAQLFRRATASYEREVASELGDLLLQAAVVANLRLCGNHGYVPDPRTLPSNVPRLRSSLRKLWGENESLIGRAGRRWDKGTSRFSSGAIPKWSDPLDLAGMAVEVNPVNPWSRITLAFSMNRVGDYVRAKSQLNAALDMARQDAKLEGRIYRNQALVHEVGGDSEAALGCIKTALVVDPGDLTTWLTYLGLSIAVGCRSEIRRCLQRYMEIERQASCRAHLIELFSRKNTPPRKRILADVDLQRMIARELRISRHAFLLKLGEEE